VKTTNQNLIAFKTPIGIVRVFEAGGKVTAIDIAVGGAKVLDSSSPVLKLAKAELEKYFAGKLQKQ
jgi:hypothetical protein